ncbi:MAG: hypothetical protein V4691_01690 [Pseudomonadota bacterium]
MDNQPFWKRRSRELGVIALVVIIIIALKLAAALLTHSFSEVLNSLISDIVMIALWAAPFACGILFGLFVKDRTGRSALAVLLGIVVYFAVASFFVTLSDTGYLPQGWGPGFKYEWNYHFTRGAKDI